MNDDYVLLHWQPNGVSFCSPKICACFGESPLFDMWRKILSWCVKVAIQSAVRSPLLLSKICACSRESPFCKLPPIFFIHGENPPLKIRESPPFEVNCASPLFLQLVEISFLWEVEIFYGSLSLIKYFASFLNAYGYGKCIYAWLTWRFLQGCNPCLVW